MTGPGGRLLRWLTLSFRMQRWEVIASVAGTALAVAAMLVLTSQMRSLAAAHPECPDPASYAPGCEQFSQSFQGLADWASQLLRVAWAAPFGMGLVLGVPLVAREVEHRTAAMAWTVSRSRVVWLARRVAFVALVLIVLLAVLAITAEVMASAIAPTRHLDQDFTWYGRRGLLIAARGLASLGLGIAIGALVGRQLPALLVAVFASALLFGAVTFGMDRWNETDAVVATYDVGPFVGQEGEGALQLGQRVELLSGEVVAWNDAGLGNVQVIDADGAMYTSFNEETGLPDKSTQVGWNRQLIVPGKLYGIVVARESASVVGLGVLLVALAALLVTRRRPG